MQNKVYTSAGLLLLCATLCADTRRETPVGLVLIPGGSSIVPAHSETALTAKSGEILFAGDVLRTSSSPATFLFCPAKAAHTVAPSSELAFQPGQINVRGGKLVEQKPVQSCFLPSVVHVASASQQHYGVSMVRALNKAEDLKPVSRDKLDPAVVAALKPFDDVLAANPKDASALIARAAVFEESNLPANALADYKQAAAEWSDAVWIKGKIFELEEAVAIAAAAGPASATAGGKAYAILVGISKYQKLPQEMWLQYAHADAVTFDQHLRSPRGGAIAPENIILLTDEKATTAAVRNAFQTLLKGRAGKNDSVFIAMAAHGTVEIPGSKGAYILTYDSDPQDLAATALPMAEVQDLVQNQLSKVGRVALFVDVCRAGVIGSIHSTSVNSVIERLGEAEGEILGLMAGRPKELSREGPQFGGGHGAFTYFLLKGLEGDADANHDNIVDINEAIKYVTDKVPGATEDKQHPREFGTFSNNVPLSDMNKPGIPMARFPVLLDPHGGPLYFAGAAPPPLLQADVTGALQRFADALQAGRILPDAADNAFSALRALANLVSPEQYLDLQNQLRIALENRGQQVLLRYLEGDQSPQREDAFQAGARYFQAATLLTPESMYLQGREAFCRGRALLFEKKYDQAADLLERSVRFDPSGAYSYNALGIAYLEQANFQRATPAFRDAIRRAPQWTYPLHNLALASVETGDYASAIRYYNQAIRLTPQFSYLYYNLGLVYQRLNRRKEAEAAYQRAAALSPDLAEPHNALGSLRAATGKFAQAEAEYRLALQKNPNLLPARQNLALLLSGKPDRQREAIDLWRANLTSSPEYLPSRLSLAQALKTTGDTAGAIAEYREILKLKPEYVAARIELAGLLLQTKAFDEALLELQQALQRAPDNAEVLERIGDVQTALQRPAEATKAYEQAASLATDGATRKRVRGKMGQMRKATAGR